MEGNNDQFVLDICFLGSDTEVKNYFKKLIRSDLDIHNERLISVNVLKEYISRKIPSNLDSDLDQYIADVELICWHINDLDLTYLVYGHSDLISLSHQKVLNISVKESFDAFLEEIKVWLEYAHLT
ncbi:hypothetical protein I2F62_07730 [Acinetobacter sp. MD2(2019)]|nr:hypothetical protein [Acinetobacter sp. MD2(2019)]